MIVILATVIVAQYANINYFVYFTRKLLSNYYNYDKYFEIIIINCIIGIYNLLRRLSLYMKYF